jgi:Mg/Co/Ni transporter MgtE
MNSIDLKTASTDQDWYDVAENMSKYDLGTIPVVDSEGIIQGVVTVDDILPRLLDEK